MTVWIISSPPSTITRFFNQAWNGSGKGDSKTKVLEEVAFSYHIRVRWIPPTGRSCSKKESFFFFFQFYQGMVGNSVFLFIYSPGWMFPIGFSFLYLSFPWLWLMSMWAGLVKRNKIRAICSSHTSNSKWNSLYNVSFWVPSLTLKERERKRANFC